jgi:hypothetical protein
MDSLTLLLLGLLPAFAVGATLSDPARKVTMLTSRKFKRTDRTSRAVSLV